MKSKINPSKVTTGPGKTAPAARKTAGAKPTAPKLRTTPTRGPLEVPPAADTPEWLKIAREWAKEYKRTSGRDARVLGFAEERIRVFTTREVAYSIGELRVMALVLKRRESAPVEALIPA